MKTVNERKDLILNGSELSVAIEGRDTNLRIFKGSKGNNIYFRLDKFQQYSAPLNNETVLYITGENKDIINTLNLKFGFCRAKIEDLPEILQIVSKLKERDCKPW